jgi:methylenetetrahydrofolate dehydrogenase (NADP+)/methenyltetrahydrofolate cyclohydrolase
LKSIIIDGRKKADEINTQTSIRVKLFLEKFNRPPKVCLIQIGENSDSSKYLNSKLKLATSLGISAEILKLENQISLDELKSKIKVISENIDGILVQFPLPSHLSEEDVISLIPPAKEIDGLHLEHLKNIQLAIFKDKILPSTPAGVLELVLYARELLGQSTELKNVKIVICGRSKLVGAPTALIFKSLNADISICHSLTSVEERLKLISIADIVIIAVGKINFLNGSQIKKGAIVIDVGINYDLNGKMHGDVDFNSVLDIASAVTPVPGGVGPMTLAMLMRNVIVSAENQNTLNYNNK